eukprot:5447675-Prymnesium_polylepis.1
MRPSGHVGACTARRPALNRVPAPAPLNEIQRLLVQMSASVADDEPEASEQARSRRPEPRAAARGQGSHAPRVSRRRGAQLRQTPHRGAGHRGTAHALVGSGHCANGLHSQYRRQGERQRPQRRRAAGWERQPLCVPGGVGGRWRQRARVRGDARDARCAAACARDQGRLQSHGRARQRGRLCHARARRPELGGEPAHRGRDPRGTAAAAQAGARSCPPPPTRRGRGCCSRQACAALLLLFASVAAAAAQARRSPLPARACLGLSHPRRSGELPRLAAVGLACCTLRASLGHAPVAAGARGRAVGAAALLRRVQPAHCGGQPAGEVALPD